METTNSYGQQDDPNPQNPAIFDILHENTSSQNQSSNSNDKHVKLASTISKQQSQSQNETEILVPKNQIQLENAIKINKNKEWMENKKILEDGLLKLKKSFNLLIDLKLSCVRSVKYFDLEEQIGGQQNNNAEQNEILQEEKENNNECEQIQEEKQNQKELLDTENIILEEKDQQLEAENKKQIDFAFETLHIYQKSVSHLQQYAILQDDDIEILDYNPFKENLTLKNQSQIQQQNLNNNNNEDIDGHCEICEHNKRYNNEFGNVKLEQQDQEQQEQNNFMIKQEDMADQQLSQDVSGKEQQNIDLAVNLMKCKTRSEYSKAKIMFSEQEENGKNNPKKFLKKKISKKNRNRLTNKKKSSRNNSNSNNLKQNRKKSKNADSDSENENENNNENEEEEEEDEEDSEEQNNNNDNEEEEESDNEDGIEIQSEEEEDELDLIQKKFKMKLPQPNVNSERRRKELQILSEALNDKLGTCINYQLTDGAVDRLVCKYLFDKDYKAMLDERPSVNLKMWMLGKRTRQINIMKGKQGFLMWNIDKEISEKSEILRQQSKFAEKMKKRCNQELIKPETKQQEKEELAILKDSLVNKFHAIEKHDVENLKINELALLYYRNKNKTYLQYLENAKKNKGFQIKSWMLGQTHRQQSMIARLSIK